MGSKIDEILRERNAAGRPAEEQAESGKYFSILLGEGLHENFLELQMRGGLQTCFSYSDLLYFVHDPEAGCIDLEFAGFQITVKGRGLKKLFAGIKGKRVAWIREADSEMEDHPENESYIAEITIMPPQGFTGEDE